MARLAKIVSPAKAGRGRHRANAAVGSWFSGALLAGLVVPALGLSGSPVHASPLTLALAVILAGLLALLSWRYGPHDAAGRCVAVIVMFVACFLTIYATYPGSGLVVAALLGLGTGPLLPRTRPPLLLSASLTLLSLVLFLILRWLIGIEAAALALATVAAAATIWQLNDPEPLTTRKVFASSAAGVVAYAAFSVFWVASTCPSVTWFGSLHSHGPRGGNEVAITFDDGPDPPYTLEVADILEQHGVRGTFFEVGKAVVERPDVTQELVNRGHVVGDHSYFHGAFSYLDPRYPELAKTQDAFRDKAGICPALFRPPHGTHTPFMSRVVADRGMTLVTWDVSASDWIETDPARLAANILKKVKPGSVILLHDGSDGNIGAADRTVLLEALPDILDGLRAKGLHPVTLDKLLGVPAYLPNCP